MATIIEKVKNFVFTNNSEQLRLESTQALVEAETAMEYMKAFGKTYINSLESITTRWYILMMAMYTILTYVCDIYDWKCIGLCSASVVVCSLLVLIYRFLRWISTPKLGKYLFALVGILLLASLIGCGYKSEPEVTQEVKVISKDEIAYNKAIEAHSERVKMELTSFPAVTWSYNEAVQIRDAFYEICMDLSSDYTHVTEETRKIASTLQSYVYLNDLSSFAIYHSEYLKIDPEIEFWFNQYLDEFNSKK